MNNIVTFSIIVIVLLASFQTVDSIKIFIQKHKDNPDKLLRFSVIRLVTIFIVLTFYAYMLRMSSWIINSMLVLMVIVIVSFVIFAKIMYKNNIN